MCTRRDWATSSHQPRQRPREAPARRRRVPWFKPCPLLRFTAQVSFEVIARDPQSAAHASGSKFTTFDQPVDRLAAHAEMFGHLARTEEPHRPSRKEPQPFFPFFLFLHE